MANPVLVYVITTQSRDNAYRPCSKCYVTYQCDECEEPGYDMTSVVRMFAADGRLFVVDVTVARMSRTLCRLLEGPASFAHPVSDVGLSTCEFSHARVARCRSERASGRTNPAAERNERDTLSCAGILHLPHRDASNTSPLLPYPLRSHRPPIDPNYSHHAPPDVLGRSGTAAVSSAESPDGARYKTVGRRVRQGIFVL